MEINLNLDKCVSCGKCSHICPDIFKLDDNFNIYLIGGIKKNNVLILVTELNEEAKNAAKECPVKAIKLL